MDGSDENLVPIDAGSKTVNGVQISTGSLEENVSLLATSPIIHSLSCNGFENSSQINGISPVNASENGTASFSVRNSNVSTGGTAGNSSTVEVAVIGERLNESISCDGVKEVTEFPPSISCENSLQLDGIKPILASGNCTSSPSQNHQILPSENSPKVCPKERCDNPSQSNDTASGNEKGDGVGSENSSEIIRNTLDECWNENIKSSRNENGSCEVVCLDPPGNLSTSISNSSLNEVLLVTSDESSNDPLCHNYRDNSGSSVSDLSSSSEDDSVTEVIEWDEVIQKGARKHEPTCRGEFLLSDLPPIEDLTISVPEEECVQVGIVSSIVDQLVVVQALPNTPALDLGSVLFLQNGKATLGKIFDVLGQVKEPFYTVRFNSLNHIQERGVTVGADVYCAPKTDHTSYVFVSEMMKMKGSDASWEHNNEPPSVCLDYSDDEEERLARRALVGQKHGEEKDNGPPKKKRIVRRKLLNPFRHTGKNNTNQGGSYADIIRTEVPPIGGCIVPPAVHPPLCPPVFPPRPMYAPIHAHNTRPIHPPGHPPVMFATPPPNFSLPLRAGYRPSLLGPHPRNFQPSVPPPIPPPPPFFVRQFHVLPSVPPVPLPPRAPLPPYVSSHVRPLLCPPHFQPPLHEKKGPGCL